MSIKTNILNSELEFRDYLIENINYINKIIVFEDILDHVIFFYCFMENNTIIATKELELNNFSYYAKVYKYLAKKYLFHDINNEQAKTLRLIKIY